MVHWWRKHGRFLRTVVVYTLSAFGGPQAHLGLMHRIFVEKKKLINAQELIDLNVFCSILPGPTSTQILSLIAYKKGGGWLSFVTLLLWVLPASVLMFLFAVVYGLAKQTHRHWEGAFVYVAVMALGFFLFSCVKMFVALEKRKTSYAILLSSALFTFLFFHTPWVFPIVIVVCGLLGYIVNYRRDMRVPRKTVKIRWSPLVVFLAVFAISGVLSETARIQNWENRRAYNVFENYYHFGALVFGGGQTLVSMVHEKYVSSPKTRYLDNEDVLTGAGMLQTVPGPLFSMSAYVGALLFMKGGIAWQVLGAVLATIAVFMPGYLLGIFFYPIWRTLHTTAIIFRAMTGLRAAVVGILFGSFGAFLQSYEWDFSTFHPYLCFVILAGTFCLLQFTRISPPFIVVATIFIGIFS